MTKSITSQNGDRLVAFQPGQTPTRVPEHPDLPVTFACVVALHNGKALFVFNPWRDEWELPSGGINPGETPEQAAIRELCEESGQSAAALDYQGLCLLGQHPDDRLELGAIFRCELDQVVPFRENEESSQMMFWEAGQETSGYVNEIGIELIRLVEPLGG